MNNRLESAAVAEDGAEGSEDGEGEERAHVKRVEDRRDNVAEEVEVGITEVSNGGEGLAFPGDIGEPAEEHPHHQNAAVDVEPLGQAGRHHRQRRVQVPALPRRREERRAHGRAQWIEVEAGHRRRDDDGGGELAEDSESEGEEGGEGTGGTHRERVRFRRGWGLETGDGFLSPRVWASSSCCRETKREGVNSDSSSKEGGERGDFGGNEEERGG